MPDVGVTDEFGAILNGLVSNSNWTFRRFYPAMSELPLSPSSTLPSSALI